MSKSPKPVRGAPPPRITGPMHLIAACRYSLAGLARLWHETAFRIELALGSIVLGALLWFGAPGAHVAIFLALFSILLAVEALNTAIEIIVDRIAPDWQEFARNAKDLGSLAVALVYMAHAVFLAWLLWPLLWPA